MTDGLVKKGDRMPDPARAICGHPMSIHEIIDDRRYQCPICKQVIYYSGLPSPWAKGPIEHQGEK